MDFTGMAPRYQNRGLNTEDTEVTEVFLLLVGIPNRCCLRETFISPSRQKWWSAGELDLYLHRIHLFSCGSTACSPKAKQRALGVVVPEAKRSGLNE
jgi:hypothetical protein